MGHFLLLLGPSWPLLAALGQLLGLSGGDLGRSWTALGRSWAALGHSWALLGRSWHDTKKSLKNIMKKMTDLGSQNGAQREPKRTKIDHKNQCEKNISSRPSWSRLGTILGRFGTDLGVILIDLSFVFKAFRENQRFSNKYNFKIRLGPI